MTDESKKKPSPPARRGGLGRGLGALIPSAPLGNASGKGHFWSALDNPPPVDEDVKKRLVDDIVSRGQASNPAAEGGETPGHSPAGTVSRETDREPHYEKAADPAVDISVDNWPAPSGDTSESAEVSAEPAPEPVGISVADEAASPSTVRSGGDGDGVIDAGDAPASGDALDNDTGATPGHPGVTGDDAQVITPGWTAGSSPTTSDPEPEMVGEVSAESVSRETTGSVTNEGDPVESTVPPAVLIELAPAAIRANPKNPRQIFDDDELAELSESIKEFGLLQPIVVRELADGYELVMGERRLRASRLAGMDTIPVIVRQTEDDEMLRDALLENIHRVQLHPLEEAAAYQQLIDEFGVTHEELAQRIKRSRPVISNTIRLLKLPTRVQNRVAAGVISGSHARALLGLDDHDAQEALATRIVAEGLSVRATEEAVAMHVGDGAPARRASRRKRPTAPALTALADRLSDHFDTRALVQLGRTKGKIVVEFASVDDLERIIGMMAPPLATARDTVAPLRDDAAPDAAPDTPPVDGN